MLGFLFVLCPHDARFFLEDFRDESFPFPLLLLFVDFVRVFVSSMIDEEDEEDEEDED